ncbi:uncharacterized protein LOC129602912 isoform X3 [Betta splendens]|uniref:Uncharacterized protein LOC129602912 isoform X3 n=1 Tax=Betta splendens TaxID=158456 RepID=A0A9W2XDP9_BETSP|nr:uncharacterized protein LOC129602912 isoform X3 [Betta splendens]
MYLAANLRCSCVIKTLCYKAAMSSVQGLRAFVTERLTAAAAEILGAFEKTMEEYEAEIGRQRRLLDSVFKPDVKLHRIEEPADQPAHKEEQVLSNQHLCGQRNKSSLDQKDPHVKVKEEQEQLCIVPEGEQLLLKQETDDLTWIPPCGESDHDEAEPIIEHQLSSSSSPVTYSVHRGI